MNWQIRCLSILYHSKRNWIFSKTSLASFLLTYFSCFKIQTDEGRNINYQKYQLMIDKLSVAFDARFLDFRKLESNFNIFSNPFQSAPDQSPDKFQLELIDLQSTNDIKSAFK